MYQTISNSALIVIALALPALTLVWGLPAQPKYLAVLNDAAHAPVFGAFAVIIALFLQRHFHWSAQWRYLAAFSITLLAGGIIELIQPAIGRGAHLRDIWTDGLGAAAALACLGFHSSRRRWLPSALLGVALTGIGWPLAEVAHAYQERNRQAPSLLELSDQADWFFLQTRGLVAWEDRLPEPWNLPDDPASVRVRITTEPSRTIVQEEPIADWRGYRRLMIDLTNPGPVPLTLTLRVHDRIHNNDVTDRFNRTFVLEASTRSVIAISVAEIARAPLGRSLDLSHVAAWMIFAPEDSALTGRELYLTRLWLE